MKLKWLVVAAIFIIGVALIGGILLKKQSVVTNVPSKTVMLPIPKLLEDSNPDPNIADFNIIVQNGTSQFFENKSTQTMGYNGDFLGPVIKVKNGEQVNMHVKNNLGNETSVHWHGLKVSGDKDGGPHQVIKPGALWEPSFKINQPAATLWFHPHVIGSTATQVYYGLAGLMLVDDEFSDKLNIPKDYGVNDIPLILQDRSFNSDGSFNYYSNMMDGAIGDQILINGSISPTLEVKQIKMRFRILNGANARNFDISFENKLEFYQIASDGGFLEKPILENRLLVSPGERGEIIVDFSEFKEGQRITLKNFGDQIMTFIVIGEGEDHTEIPQNLVEISRLDEQKATETKRVILDGMGQMVSLNGKKFDMERIDDYANLDEIEILEITSTGSMMHGMGHPFHIHGTQFQILSRNSVAPYENELGWKDTVYVRPNETVRIIVQFQNPGLFMYHCHILEHEEAGMMGQIEVK